MKEVSTLL